MEKVSAKRKKHKGAGKERASLEGRVAKVELALAPFVGTMETNYLVGTMEANKLP